MKMNEQVRPPKTLRRRIRTLPDSPAVQPVPAVRLNDGLLRLDLPDGGAVLLQRVNGTPSGYSAVLLTDKN